MKTCSNENECTSCLDNYFLVSSKCYECNFNCKTSNDSCKCDSCNDGYYLDNNQCLLCNSSFCKTCSGSATSCLSCHDGKYLSDNNCLDCDIKCKICISSPNHCTSCNNNTISYQNLNQETSLINGEKKDINKEDEIKYYN